ncbi:MAG: tRNA (cytidine(34)-2'-O)-methyltransferase [Deltaproteobacteria bacterium]|nr:tRNA (cytidine(34)-2'-O)-methyltransferase [Deltaproteobacteria bacterium]
MQPRLRFPAPAPAFQVVLVEPEIPQNTGNIARLCVATRSTLHLVGRLGFRIDEHAVRRAGLDYWPLVDLRTWPDLAAFVSANPTARLRLFSARASSSYLEASYRAGDALVFGCEATGLSQEILEAHPGDQFAIPSVAGGVRSLNLANAVSIVLYEALRSTGMLSTTEHGD